MNGKLQLPDFQRGWVWDDEHIQSLLVSIARSFPIGAVMLLGTGGETRFQVRAVEGVDLPPNANPEELILDGQQRLTSLTQVLKLEKPVATRDAKKRELKLHYYFDIEKALLGPQALVDAIVTVDEQRTQREDFGRKVVLDLSTRARTGLASGVECGVVPSVVRTPPSGLTAADILDALQHNTYGVAAAARVLGDSSRYALCRSCTSTASRSHVWSGSHVPQKVSSTRSSGRGGAAREAYSCWSS